MWNLDDLMEKENDSMERNSYNEIENIQESLFITDEEVENLVEDNVYSHGRSDYDHKPNVDYKPEYEQAEPEYKVEKKSYYLIEYVRKNNRDKKGVLIAVKHDDEKVVIGWSLCSSFDTFDKYFGQGVAYERGAKRFYDDDHFKDIPPSITEHLDNFIDRCKKYFKNCEFPSWTI